MALMTGCRRTSQPAQREKGRWRAVGRVGRIGLAGIGVVCVVALLWLLTSWPLGVDSWLDVSRAPQRADAIICLGGGTTTGRLPTEDGWRRVYTASQLFLDGYAPLVVFSGRGSERVSEAEIYAGAAVWLGVPRETILLDAGPASTAEHALTVLQAAGGRIRRDSRVLLVTSPVHSRRALLTFQKQGFSNVRVVSSWSAKTTGGNVPGHAATSAMPGFVRDHKVYNDPLLRLQTRSRDLLDALREWSAIAWYWWRGAV